MLVMLEAVGLDKKQFVLHSLYGLVEHKLLQMQVYPIDTLSAMEDGIESLRKMDMYGTS